MKKLNKKLYNSIDRLFNLASNFEKKSNYLGAIDLYKNWLFNNKKSKLSYLVYFNLGVLYYKLQDLNSAKSCYKTALIEKADFFQAIFNLGVIFEEQQQFANALQTWESLIKLPPDAVGTQRELLILALNRCAALLERLQYYRESEVLCTQSLLLNPLQSEVIQHWVHLRQKQCLWPILIDLPGLPKTTSLLAISGMSLLGLSDDPNLQLAAARRFVTKHTPRISTSLAPTFIYGHKKLRIGYLSSDFSMHPVSMLMVEALELHDRESFEIYGFCSGKDDGSTLRQRILAALDHYFSIESLSDEDAALFIRNAEIDILLDLNGLTEGARFGVLAHRPAPVQISYLGFPGTTGIPFIDYILCDHYLIPENYREFFSEEPLYISTVFQVCDQKKPVGKTLTRSDYGLPEQKIIFCSFNSNTKYTPELFSVWISILTKVPNSVLWLLADNAMAKSNLLSTANQQNIDSGRIIFADRVSPEDYLARYQVVDIFLDCYPFNGGTTVNDALWMEVPVVTRSGKTLASRMAGSLLTNLGLPELIADDFNQYEELAISLATNKLFFSKIKNQLKIAKSTADLFCTKKQVTAIENAFFRIAKCSDTGRQS